MTCKCFARCEADCVCDHDWTPPAVIALREEVERLRAEIAECRQALRDVLNPLGKIQRENPGAKINGAACVSLFGDPQYYKDIARAALAKGDA
jgi:hypothetical protein